MNIKTDRLTIRKIVAEDWERIQEIWDNQKKSPYARFDRPNDTTPDAVQKRIEKWASFADSLEHIFFAICLDKILIGYVAFNQRDGGYEIGYCFHSKYHRKGYAKESIRELIQIIQNTQPNAVIKAGTALENIPSVKLLQSLCFRLIEIEHISFYKDANDNAIYFDGGIFELRTQNKNL